MQHPEPNIRRVESRNAWHVVIQRGYLANGKIRHFRKWFGDRNHGGKRGALKAARAWRDQQLLDLPEAARAGELCPRRVSDEQRRALQTIASLTLRHGRPPSLSEIGEVLGCGKLAVFDRLRWLEKKELWRRDTRTLTAKGFRAALVVDD